MENKKRAGLTRRSFLKINASLIAGTLIGKLVSVADPKSPAIFAQTSKRIYIALDDHTDYMWTADEATYQQAFLDMIDYYLDLADATEGNRPEHQSRFNCDGSFWLWTYEKNKPKTDYERLISRIRDGHISIPLNPLVILYGGVPAEAVLRGMYYPGKIERRENLRFNLAVSMENQTLPYGLGGLWAGAGAKYSWKGICGCATKVPSAGDREHDIYWWQSVDGSRILMKWNSFWGNQSMGGYAEARNPSAVIDFVDSDPDFIARYPYSIIGCFGKGWDDLETKTDEFVTVAQVKTTPERLVVVSNEEDFFRDFEVNFGNSIPIVSASFGNEWDLYCASMAETSARVKRAVEALRSAEAIATLVSLINPSFMDGLIESRDKAWMDLGLYWEHDWTADGPIPRSQRRDWQQGLEGEIRDYLNALSSSGLLSLGGLIQKSGSNPRFYAFNPLSWMRSDYVDLPFSSLNPVHVIDLATGEETPSQFVTVDGQSRLRIMAQNVPSLGYKVYEIQSGAGQTFSDAATIIGGVIENQFYQVTVSERGAITSWVDKSRGNRQFVKTVNGRVINDLGSSTGTLQVENVGPVTVTLLANASSPLEHTSRITFIRNSRRIEIRNDINQNFSDIYTWGFGFELTNPDVWHEEVGAILRAKLTTQNGHYSPRNARYDWLTINHFADMSGDGNVGVTLSNADCYFMRLGSSDALNLDVTTPQISPLVGGQVDGPGLGIPDQGGDSHFLQRFALTSHDAFNPVDAMKFAMEHQNPLVAGEVTGGSVYPEASYSFLNIDNPNVLLWALKPHEDGIDKGIVVRLWNLSDNPAAFNLTLAPGPIISALRLTHIETPIEAANISGGALSETLVGHQMRTYSISTDVILPTPIPTATSTVPTAMPGTPPAPTPTCTNTATASPNPGGTSTPTATIDPNSTPYPS
ncbi:MAG: hypothetical protein HXY24_10360, partial [Rubrivivax sp.]|nr:hypothetical protein [Rubrivivax sp.]